MAELKLCRGIIEIEAPAVLGIHSNVAGDNNDFTAGHAWITVTTRRQTYFFGLWPDAHPMVVDHSPDCTDVRIGMEAGQRPLVSRYYSLTATQLIKLNRFINEPNVWGYTNTCADWAVKLLRDVVGSNISASDYVLFATPRELGRQIMILERQHPTTIVNPRQGEFPDGRPWSYQ